jgi:hypothetical protein
MRWRYLIAAVIGGVIGFTAQFLVEFLWMDTGGGDVMYQYLMLADKCDADYLANPKPGEREQERRYRLACGWYSLLVLLQERDDVFGLTSAITALLGTTSVLAVDELRARRTARKGATVS